MQYIPPQSSNEQGTITMTVMEAIIIVTILNVVSPWFMWAFINNSFTNLSFFWRSALATGTPILVMSGVIVYLILERRRVENELKAAAPR